MYKTSVIRFVTIFDLIYYVSFFPMRVWTLFENHINVYQKEVFI